MLFFLRTFFVIGAPNVVFFAGASKCTFGKAKLERGKVKLERGKAKLERAKRQQREHVLFGSLCRGRDWPGLQVSQPRIFPILRTVRVVNLALRRYPREMFLKG